MNSSTESFVMDPDLNAPDIVFCGFRRISKTSYGQSDKEAAQLTADQEIVLTIKLATSDPYDFELSIHRQADVQTLARTIETLLSDRRIIVAGLIDQGSENVLRWTDRVLDVLDAESVVKVLPVNEHKLLRVLQSTSSRPSTPRMQSSVMRSSEDNDTASIIPRSPSHPQLEFIHLTERSSSTTSIPTNNSTLSTSARPILADNKRTTSKGLRLLRPNAVRQPSDIVPSSPTNHSMYLPPLPTSPMPRAIVTPLSKLCSNAIALSALLRYSSRKKTLCEMLFWLDTIAASANDEYIDRVYLAPDAPLRLNIPREVSTAIEARELLRDGCLAWTADGFLKTSDGLRVQEIETDYPAYYDRARITISAKANSERSKFIETLSMALHPEDTSILSLKERQVLGTRQAILEQVYAQYLPEESSSTAKYFEYSFDQMTKPERNRLANRRHMFGALFDRRSPPAELVQISAKAEPQSRGNAGPASTPGSTGTSPPVSKKSSVRRSILREARVEEIMPMEDTDGWTDVRSVRDSASFLPLENSESTEVGDDASIIGTEHNDNGHHSTNTTPIVQRSKSNVSRPASIMSVDTQASPNLTLSEFQRTDHLKRQTKLRSLLGVAPSDALDAQTESIAGDYVDHSVPMRSHSPTHSISSRYSATSSRMSALRRDQSEDNDRRTQARRAAKLYAMFGEHADSASSTPSYRNKSNLPRSGSINEYSPRPASSASQYSPAYSRVPGRPGSISGHSLYSPASSRNNLTPNSILSKHDSRYQPDRQNTRKGLKGMFNKTSKQSPLSPEILSNFPSPPATGSPTSNTFNRAFPKSGQYTSSLYQDDESILEVDSDDEDDEGEAIVQDVRTNMKLRQLLGNDAPTSTVT